MKKRKCWYFVTYYECPVCGRGESIRERRYTKKPAQPGKRCEWDRLSCGCYAGIY